MGLRTLASQRHPTPIRVTPPIFRTLFTLYETIAEDMISHAETDGATYIIN